MVDLSGFHPRSERMTHHDVDFLLDLCEHRLICDCDALEDMMCRAVHRCRCPDEVDMCKAAYPSSLQIILNNSERKLKEQTLAKVAFYLDGKLVDRDCLAWDKGALVAGLLEGHTG